MTIQEASKLSKDDVVYVTTEKGLMVHQALVLEKMLHLGGVYCCWNNRSVLNLIPAEWIFHTQQEAKEATIALTKMAISKLTARIRDIEKVRSKKLAILRELTS